MYHRRANALGIVICAGRSSRYLERKCVGRFRDRNMRIWDGSGNFERNKKGVWRRR